MRLMLLLVMLSAYFYGRSQCCSGGVPMSGNIGMPPAAGGTWQFNLNYDHNNLQTFKSGSKTINDRTRERQTRSALLEFGYAVTDKVSVDGFFSFVRQERRIDTQPNEEDFTFTQGIGDAAVLAKYQVLNSLSFGYGVKFPLGSSDKTSNGISLVADLQPGSGAWDQLFYGNFSRSTGFRPTFSYYGIFIYRLTGENDAYLGQSTYRFGNEAQLIAGLSDRFTLFNQIIDPSVQVRYRYTERDRFNDFGFSSSGGKFLFINPGLAWQIRPSISYQVNVELPLAVNVNETQLSPSFRLNTGVQIIISKKQIDISL